MAKKIPLRTCRSRPRPLAQVGATWSDRYVVRRSLRIVEGTTNANNDLPSFLRHPPSLVRGRRVERPISWTNQFSTAAAVESRTRHAVLCKIEPVLPLPLRTSSPWPRPKDTMTLRPKIKVAPTNAREQYQLPQVQQHPLPPQIVWPCGPTSYLCRDHDPQTQPPPRSAGRTDAEEGATKRTYCAVSSRPRGSLVKVASRLLG